MTALILGMPALSFAGAADVTGHHVLSNGLEIRLFPRAATPLVATLVLVKTGYALEDATNRGYSHLLEHLVFAGTERMDKKTLFREVESMGGYLNGYTRDDYMGYIMVGHRDHLDRQMELLADILFGAALKEEALKEAREVVIEEIRRRDSRPDTRAKDMFQALLYEGSSYARTGLGSERTVSAVSRASIVDHYHRVYRPENMVLLMAGGFESEDAFATLEKVFEAPEPGAGIVEAALPPPLKAKRVYTLRSEMPGLRVMIGFNGPEPRSEDAEALELLGSLLGGPGGRLKEALVTDGFSPRGVGAGLSVNRGFSRFVISAGFPAETDGSRALATILEEIARVALQGPEETQVDIARESMVAEDVMNRETPHYYLMGKAPWVLAGAPGQAVSDGRWDSFGAEAMKRMAKTYLHERPYAGLVASPSTPADPELERIATPRERTVLPNGLVVVAEQRPGSRIFALSLMTRRRSAAEPEGKAGIADFLHRMLSRGTQSLSRDQIERQLRQAGVSLSAAGNPTVPFGDFYTSRSYSALRLECLQDKAGPVLELLSDLVRNPSFPPDEMEKVRSQMKDYIAFREASPDRLAARLLAEGLYGPGPFARDVLGLEETVLSLTREDLASFHEEYFTGRNLILAVVSGLPPAEALALVAPFFEGLASGDEIRGLSLEVTGASEPVERELGRSQGALAAGAVLGPVPKQYREALEIAAGLLRDRLFRQLREKEGLAYSIGASLGTVEGTGVFSLSMGTAPEKIAQARRSVRREIEAARTGKVTDEDLARRVNAVTGQLQRRMFSSVNRAFYLGLAERKGLSHTFGEDYRRLLLALTPEDVREAAAKYLPRTLHEVIVR